MRYTVLLKRSAERELEKLPRVIHDRVVKELLRLEEDPRPHGSKKLSGEEAFRLRVGDYRILYLIDDAKNKWKLLQLDIAVRSIADGY